MRIWDSKSPVYDIIFKKKSKIVKAKASTFKAKASTLKAKASKFDLKAKAMDNKSGHCISWMGWALSWANIQMKFDVYSKLRIAVVLDFSALNININNNLSNWLIQ